MSGLHLPLLRHPGLGESAPVLERHLEDWIAACRPEQLIGLVDSAARSLFHEAFSAAGGCEGTVWIADPKDACLVACYNTGADSAKLVGFRQPMGQGIISMVYAQQQPYCENRIHASAGHDDTLDRKIAKHTTAMIAVPFYFGFGLRGVVSCVQLEEAAASRDGFNSTDVEVLVRVANLVERLINGALVSAALGLGDAI